MTDFFTLEEMRCKDKARTPYPAEYVDDGTWFKLRSTLNTIRLHWSAALEVVSGYRTPAHNAKKGAKKSQHMFGRAADIKPLDPHSSARALHTMILALHQAGKLPHLGGIGEYPRWVHVDVRPRKANGSLYRWSSKDLKD